MPKGYPTIPKPKRAVIHVIGPSIAYVPLTKGQFALIDKHNAESIGKHNWFALWSPLGKTFYAMRCKKTKGKSKTIWMAVEILNPVPGKITDHIIRKAFSIGKSLVRIKLDIAE